MDDSADHCPWAKLIFWDAKRQRVALPGPGRSPDSSDPANALDSAAGLGIEKLTKAELLRRVEILNSRLRQFRKIENGVRDVEDAEIDSLSVRITLMTETIKGDQSEQERLKIEAENAKARIEPLRNARIVRLKSEFRAQFLPEVTQVRAELARRIGRPINGVDDPIGDLLENGIVNDESLDALRPRFKSHGAGSLLRFG